MGPFKSYLEILKLAVRHSMDHAQYVLFVVFLIVGGGSYAIPKLANWESVVTGSQAALIVVAAVIAARLFLAPYWLYRDTVEALKATEGDEELLELKRREVAALEMQNAVRTAEIQQRDEERRRVAEDVFNKTRRGMFR